MIVFSDHAKKQLTKRKIFIRQALLTIEKPENVTPGFRDRVLQRRIFGKRIMEVVTITEGSRITVITAYYLGE